MNIGDNISFNARIRFNNRIADIPKKNKSFLQKTAACTYRCLNKPIGMFAGFWVISKKAKKMIIQAPAILTKITNIKNSIKLPS